jgi:putative nucleotidyltransferase with HDIG domain
MSDVAMPPRLRTAPQLRLLPPRELAWNARAYWWALALTATLAAIATAAPDSLSGDDWRGFAFLAACATTTQLFSIEKPGNRVFHAALVFVIAATVLLPPLLIAAMCLIQHLPDWARRRYAWYIQTFNICNYILCALAAAFTFAATHAALPTGQASAALSGLAGATVFLLTNRVLLAAMLQLARGVRLNASGLFGFEDIAVESVLCVMGVVVGVSLIHAPWIVPLSVAPLVIIYYLQVQARQLQRSTETIQDRNKSLADLNVLLRERTIAAMEGLVATVDARDAYTAGHARRVQQLSLLLGRELNLDRGDLELVSNAALFHDIGKIAVPDAVLLKAGPLNDVEWAIMKTHSEEGAQIIARLGFLDAAVPAIRHHHERMDGTGYPDGLHGEQIPLAARIIHLADALDTMLSERVYSGPRSAVEVLAEVRRNTGDQFCPRCAAALERVVDRHGTGVIVPRDAVPQTPRVPLAKGRRIGARRSGQSSATQAHLAAVTVLLASRHA